MSLPPTSGPAAGGLPPLSNFDRSLKGRWVTSFAGWMHFEPLPELTVAAPTPTQALAFQQRARDLPPQFGGYDWIPPLPYVADDPGRYVQREGYFAYAAWLCFDLDGAGHLTGIGNVNRGGPGKLVRNDFTGTYTGDFNAFDVFEGKIHTTHINTGGMSVTQHYSFIMKSPSELEWLWGDRDDVGNFRAIVARGTLTKVPYSKSP